MKIKFVPKAAGLSYSDKKVSKKGNPQAMKGVESCRLILQQQGNFNDRSYRAMATSSSRGNKGKFGTKKHNSNY